MAPQLINILKYQPLNDIRFKISNLMFSSDLAVVLVTVIIFISMNSKQFRMLIYLSFLMGKSTVATKGWIDKCCSNSALSKSTAQHWFADFKRCSVQTPMMLNALGVDSDSYVFHFISFILSIK